MQQLFSTRNYSVRDFEEWTERGELVLAPKFQRRSVWNAKAQSFLMDTIIRGKPIPKLYMRQSVNVSTRRALREIVDGQQRLRTVLSFIKDGFKLSRTHNRESGGRFFSELDEDTQKEILKYEFVVDLLQDMPDNEIYDVFARINTYSERLKPQELRNALYFGEFKTSVYELSREFVGFLQANRIFNDKQILRMAEAEFISELLLALEEGIREGKRAVIDRAYVQYDDVFTSRLKLEKRFAEVIDTIGQLLGEDLKSLRFRAAKLFYPLFCSVYHLKYGLPNLIAPRKTIKAAEFPRLKAAVEQIDVLIDSVEKGVLKPTGDDRRLFEAQAQHWVHASNRTVLTQQISKRLVAVMR